MTGIQYLTDENGRKTAAVIDLRKHKALWEDIQDVLVSQSRKHEKGIPLDKIKAGLIKRKSFVNSYLVKLKPSVSEELDVLSAKLIKRIVDRLENLSLNPRPRGCKKLQGGNDEWRIRIGDYRVVYTIDDKRHSIEVTRIRHRSTVFE